MPRLLDRRKVRISVPQVEGLEGRVLLSVAAGEVRKRPAFSVDYVGPHRANLNLVGASAVLKSGVSLTLSATTAAKINTRPASGSVADASFFVFGLDRGGPSAVALFPRRPGIRFDAVVVARITPAGISGYVLDIARGNIQTELDPARVKVSGRTVRVTLPPDAAASPEVASPPTRTRFAAWSRSRLEHTLADIDAYVASFAPENATARIRVVRR